MDVCYQMLQRGEINTNAHRIFSPQDEEKGKKNDKLRKYLQKIPWIPGRKQLSWEVWKAFWKDIEKQCNEENEVYIDDDNLQDIKRAGEKSIDRWK